MKNTAPHPAFGGMWIDGDTIAVDSEVTSSLVPVITR